MRVGYLLIMVSVTLFITFITVPSLFFPKCKFCGKRNIISRTNCRFCNKQIEQDYISLLNQAEHRQKDLKE